MKIRNLGPDLDWVFGSGRQNYLTLNNAIRLNIATRIRSFLNDCWFDLEAGIDWWNLMGSKNPAAQPNTILACRAEIAQSYGVAKIDSVTASTDVRTRKLSVQFSITTIFNTTVAGTVSP